MKIFQTILTTLFTFSFFCISPVSNALKSDSNKTALVQADYIQQTPPLHQTILLGHVIATQGTTQVQANKVTIYRDANGKARQVILLGGPARYQTLPDGNKLPLIALAKKIIYYPKQHHIILIGDAKINQNGNVIMGPHLVYNTQTQTLLSKTHGERTTIIFQPQS